jgi:hypothetical protein
MNQRKRSGMHPPLLGSSTTLLSISFTRALVDTAREQAGPWKEPEEYLAELLKKQVVPDEKANYNTRNLLLGKKK